jgi:protein TonB
MRVKNSLFTAIFLFALATASGDELRKPISKPTPRYPEIAKRLNLVGSVKVEVVISPDGRVKETNVLGGHPILVDSVLSTLKEWKYEPAKAETSATLTFDFRP